MSLRSLLTICLMFILSCLLIFTGRVGIEFKFLAHDDIFKLHEEDVLSVTGNAQSTFEGLPGIVLNSPAHSLIIVLNENGQKRLRQFSMTHENDGNYICVYFNGELADIVELHQLKDAISGKALSIYMDREKMIKATELYPNPT